MELFLCRISYQELLKRAAFHYPLRASLCLERKGGNAGVLSSPKTGEGGPKAGGEGENPDRTGTIIALSIDVSLCA
ncbi:hypothetical protein FHS20_003322 [Phyllobacterium endophyticum]|uniref:Uncharacterized protein n=1 Tax=Phyllobacterium endophyticum TaxID=1149773 RepID=A0A2P7ALE9_9HYPH|nr:hypothetical protein [Phyllobacterium endophyticum]PSH55035.1 hypothetical protein CU100_23315 [Phyllobacterium endophyticum]